MKAKGKGGRPRHDALAKDLAVVARCNAVVAFVAQRMESARAADGTLPRGAKARAVSAARAHFAFPDEDEVWRRLRGMREYIGRADPSVQPFRDVQDVEAARAHLDTIVRRAAMDIHAAFSDDDELRAIERLPTDLMQQWAFDRREIARLRARLTRKGAAKPARKRKAQVT